MAEQNNSLPSSSVEITMNQLVFPAILAMLSIITTVGNLLVIVTVYKDPRRELRTVSSYLVVNLAVADLVIGLIAEPSIISLYWAFDLKLLQAYTLLVYFALDASCLTILFLTIERYITLEMPLWRDKLFSGVALKIYISLIWLHTLITSLLFIPFRQLKSYYFFITISNNVQVLIMFGLYVRMFVIIRNFNKAILAQGVQEPLLAPGPAYTTTRIREHKFAKAICLFVGTFALCYLPYCITRSVRISLFDSIIDISIIYQSLLLLPLLNSALNPLLYTFIIPGFRRAVKKIFNDFKLRCRQNL